MTFNKRKKNSRQRASHTHGWGAMKKHRGAGNRGGAGRAGSGKRSDSKKPSYWKDTKFFGKHGFLSKGVHKQIRAVNIAYLDENLDKLLEKGLAKKESSGIHINLKDLGYNKLLSKGRTTRKLIVTCDEASAKAVDIIVACQGKVVLPKGENNGTKGHTSKPA